MIQAKVKITWRGPQVVRTVKDTMRSRLRHVGELVASTIRRRLSTGGPPASAPGSYPHAVTGRLRNSVTHSPIKDGVMIIAPVEYAAYLEDGTAAMEARPFLARTVRDLQPQIMRILGRPVSFTRIQ